MRSLIVYSSRTGNTRKLAEAVFEVLPDPKEIYSTEKAPDPTGYDFVAVGFALVPVEKPEPRAMDYLTRVKTPALFIFASHGTARDSDLARRVMAYAQGQAVHAQVVGTFHCQGEVPEKVIAALQAKPNPPSWLIHAPQAVGHPDDSDIQELKTSILKVVGTLQGE